MEDSLACQPHYTWPPAPSVLKRYFMGWSVKVAADWMVVMAAGSSAVATEPESRMTEIKDNKVNLKNIYYFF